MSAKNVHNAMSGNRPRLEVRGSRLVCFALFLSLIPFSGSKAYEGAAPALSGVQEILVRTVHLGGGSISKGCVSSEEKLSGGLVKSFKNYDVPAVSVIDAKPAQIGSARVDMIPEIIVSGSQGLECTSWVSLSAQTQQTLRIPPLEAPRNVIVTYWRGGLMVSSTSTSHPQALADALDKLARQFAQQFKLDQPPPLPASEDEKK
jgi:hypothetical protein